jgi:hypothetical protein
MNAALPHGLKLVQGTRRNKLFPELPVTDLRSICNQRICHIIWPYTINCFHKTGKGDNEWNVDLCLAWSFCGSRVPLLDLGRFFSFLILYTDGRAPCTSDQPVTRPLTTHKTTQTQKEKTQTSMPWVRFEPTNPAFEPAKTVRALDRAANMIGKIVYIHEPSGIRTQHSNMRRI